MKDTRISEDINIRVYHDKENNCYRYELEDEFYQSNVGTELLKLAGSWNGDDWLDIIKLIDETT